jgi:thiol-disulfide isomerase/thioredoxin
MKSFCFLLFVIITQLNAAAQTSSEIVLKDTTSSKLETAAQFPGGRGAWMRYLERNLNANIAANDKAPVGNYTVKVQFVVDKEGNVSSVTAASTPERCPGCGPEAVRVIKMGPKWTPAMRDGIPVEYKATQLITFQVRGDQNPFSLPHPGQALVQFSNISLKEAIQEAGAKGKMVFAQFINDGCPSCNDIAEIAFADKALATAISEKCVGIKIGMNNPDRVEFIKKYNPTSRVGTFFIASDGELLGAYIRSSTKPGEYMAELEKAYSKQTEGRVTLKELDEEWNANPQNFMAMELNLARRQSFGWFTDKLLDVYVKRLPQDSLQSTRVLTFIASMAPSLFSPGNAVLRRDNNMFREVWYNIPEPKRIAINRQIISKSMGAAMVAKNKAMAETVANFAKRTYDSEPPVTGQQEYDRQMMYFYRGSKDTATCLVKAVAFYDTYYMTIDADAVKRTDSINRRKALDTAKGEKVEDPMNKGKYIMRKSISVIPQAIVVARELIMGAQTLYTLTNDKACLQKATTWATRGRELSPFVDMDAVLPKLLYVQGEKAQAIALQKETINQLQQAHATSTAQKTTLQLMETNQKLPGRIAY